ncbi:MAG: hypothetical protein OEW08_11640 [Gammaproteobacteria bacterium]|nr:hypothetical protein [Gammaproteobacteria bacterium]
MSIMTPWGWSQTIEQIADGIQFISTAGHGGIRLSVERNREMPDYLRIQSGWYEEDVDWARVAIAFPQYFKKQEMLPIELVRNWLPDEYELHTGKILAAGESIEKDRREWAAQHSNDYVVTSAWGDWHPKVPKGHVVVAARIPAHPENAGYFVVPSAEYCQRSRFGFAVELARHPNIEPINL